MNTSLLRKATSSEDGPVPGYLYVEIAKMTYQGPNVVEKVVKYLVSRLQRNNVNSRLKALQVIKHVCRKGDQSFRRIIQAGPNVAAVKACLQFTGPPDPLRGDAPYQAVRNAAKDALEAIYDNTTEVTAQNSALANRIQGYGNTVPTVAEDQTAAGSRGGSTFVDSIASASTLASSVIAAATGGGTPMSQSSSNMLSQSSSYAPNSLSLAGSGGKRYEGIGNPHFSDPRNKPKGFIDRVRDRLEKFNEQHGSSGDSSKQTWMSSSNTSGFSFPSNRDPNAYDSGSYQGPGSTGGGASSTFSYPSNPNRIRGRGEIGGVWGSTSEPNTSSAHKLPSSFQAPLESTMYGGYSNAGAAASDGKYERGLIEELCNPGGVRAVPPKNKLSAFCKACETLDPAIVMPILDEKLNSDDWKVQHKALCVCEALVQASGCESYADYLDDNPETLEALCESSNVSVRNRCKRVWRLLYGEDPEASNNAESALSFSNEGNTDESRGGEISDWNSTNVDLLGFVDDESGREQGGGEIAATQVSAMTKSAHESTSMFSGLTAKQPPAQEVDLFDSMVMKTEPNNGQASSNTDKGTNQQVQLTDQLEGLSFSSSPAAGNLTETSSSGFSFIASHQASSMPSPSKPPPIVQPEKPNSDKIGTAFDDLVRNNLSPRRNPIPRQPNMVGIQPTYNQPSGVPVNAMMAPSPSSSITSASGTYLQNQNPYAQMPMQMQQPMNQMRHSGMGQVPMHMQSMPVQMRFGTANPPSSSSGAGNPSRSSSSSSNHNHPSSSAFVKKEQTSVPDKFDFVKASMDHFNKHI